MTEYDTLHNHNISSGPQVSAAILSRHAARARGAGGPKEPGARLCCTAAIIIVIIVIQIIIYVIEQW